MSSSETALLDGGPSERQGLSPLAIYGIVVLVLVVLKFLAGVVVVPEGLAMGLRLLSTLVFVGLPIAGLIVGARHEWKGALPWLMLLAGVALHVGILLTLRSVGVEGVQGVGLRALMEAGVMLWSLGLGALVSILIKEKNLLPPVAIFLAGFDIFIILNPDTPQAQIVRNNVEVVRNIGLTVPQVRPDTAEERSQGARIRDLGYVGPADLFVTAALFAVLARYRMKYRESALWLVPVLFCYMILALTTPFGGLPALVPIGATVLIVNAREFRMNREEKQATVVVALISLGLAAAGIYKAATYTPPAEPVESLPRGDAPALPGPEGTPGPGP